MTKALLSLAILNAVAIATVLAIYVMVGPAMWNDGASVVAATIFAVMEIFTVGATIGPVLVRWIENGDRM